MASKLEKKGLNLIKSFEYINMTEYDIDGRWYMINNKESLLKKSYIRSAVVLNSLIIQELFKYDKKD